jgi:ribosomal protein S6--L-glutamate ligase
MTEKQKLIIGWEEWAALPELGIPALKIKADTGARTSAIHAVNIRKVRRKDGDYVKFVLHPFIKNETIYRECCLPIIGQRYITSSDGDKELRYVVKTKLVIKKHHFQIELTLTNRESMRLPMLLGREALAKFAVVDAGKAYRLGKMSVKAAKSLYKEKL